MPHKVRLKVTLVRMSLKEQHASWKRTPNETRHITRQRLVTFENGKYVFDGLTTLLCKILIATPLVACLTKYILRG